MSEEQAQSPDTPSSLACETAFPVTVPEGKEEGMLERGCLQAYRIIPHLAAFSQIA